MNPEWKRLTERHAYPRKSVRKYPAQTNAPEILRDLEWLAGYATSPDNPNSMAEKDENATKAIVMAGQLLGPLLEWAIHHITGRQQLGRGPLVPERLRTPDSTQLAQRLQIQNLSANSHENEYVGSSYDAKNPILNREVAATVFFLLSRGMDFAAGTAVSIALKDLEEGEIHPELERARKNRKPHSVQLDRLKLFALGHVAFRKARGGSVLEAQRDVCLAFNVSEDALKKWGLNRGTNLSSIKEWQFSRYIFEAKSVGLLHACIKNGALRKKLPKVWMKTDFTNSQVQRKLEQLAERYSPTRLTIDGESFQALTTLARKRRLPGADKKKKK